MEPNITIRRHRMKPTAQVAARAAVGRRVGSQAPAASATAIGETGSATLIFRMANGLLEIADAPLVQALLENEQRQRLAAEAEQAALALVYRLSGEPDPTRPYGGLLTLRLDIGERTAGELLRQGKLRYTCTGKKNYRVSERAVREFLGDLPPPA